MHIFLAKKDKIGIQDENRRHMLMISCSFCSKVVFFDFCQNRLYESVQQFQNRRAKLVSGEFFVISEDRVGGKSCSCLLICLLFIFFRNGIFQIWSILSFFEGPFAEIKVDYSAEIDIQNCPELRWRVIFENRFAEKNVTTSLWLALFSLLGPRPGVPKRLMEKRSGITLAIIWRKWTRGT